MYKYKEITLISLSLSAGPSDSQRVAQSLSSEIMLVVVLDEALFEILDHKNSRRLLYKIRGRGNLPKITTQATNVILYFVIYVKVTKSQ